MALFAQPLIAAYWRRRGGVIGQWPSSSPAEAAGGMVPW
jgi:hypothetical protein